MSIHWFSKILEWLTVLTFRLVDSFLTSTTLLAWHDAITEITRYSLCNFRNFTSCSLWLLSSNLYNTRLFGVWDTTRDSRLIPIMNILKLHTSYNPTFRSCPSKPFWTRNQLMYSRCRTVKYLLPHSLFYHKSAPDYEIWKAYQGRGQIAGYFPFSLRKSI